MADVVVSEVICFISTHFGNVPNNNVQSVISNFYSEDDLLKARTQLNEVCGAKLAADDVPRIITHKGDKDKKKKALAEDILSLFVRLDEKKCVLPLFVAHNLRKVPLIDPGSVDMCFLLETVSDLKKKVDMLDDLKKKLDDLQASVQLRFSSPPIQPAPTIKMSAPAGSSAVHGGSDGSLNAVGMAQDTSLRVNLQSTSRPWNQVASRNSVSAAGQGYGAGSGFATWGYVRQPRRVVKPIVGSKGTTQNIGLKASNIPKLVHLHIGNLDVGTTVEQVADFVHEVDPAIRLHTSEIIRSTRFADPRCVSAHIAVSGIDREKVFLADLWPEDVTIRLWRFWKRNNVDGNV